MRILVLQHDIYQTAGRFLPMMEAAGMTVTSLVASEVEDWPDPGSFDALWAMGGAQQVWETDAHPWLTDEIAFIRDAVTRDGKPYFGVCFGHQLLACACGGTVGPTRAVEFGLTEVTGGDAVLARGDGAPQPVFQWHSAEVHDLPRGFTSGWTNAASRYQTMHGPRGVHSVQFHPEVDATLLQSWYDMPGLLDDLERIGGPDLADRLLAEFAHRDAAMDALAVQLFDRWRAAARG